LRVYHDFALSRPRSCRSDGRSLPRSRLCPRCRATTVPALLVPAARLRARSSWSWFSPTRPDAFSIPEASFLAPGGVLSPVPLPSAEGRLVRPLRPCAELAEGAWPTLRARPAGRTELARSGPLRALRLRRTDASMPPRTTRPEGFIPRDRDNPRLGAISGSSQRAPRPSPEPTLVAGPDAHVLDDPWSDDRREAVEQLAVKVGELRRPCGGVGDDMERAVVLEPPRLAVPGDRRPDDVRPPCHQPRGHEPLLPPPRAQQPLDLVTDGLRVPAHRTALPGEPTDLAAHPYVRGATWPWRARASRRSSG
jgi:hypothetical protein